jgi:hypothetical protein
VGLPIMQNALLEMRRFLPWLSSSFFAKDNR